MSARPTAPSRTSTSKPPPPPTKITPTTLVHPTAILIGSHPIDIGPKAIIQLRARVDSTYTPVTIGDGSIINERASLGYLSPPRTASSATARSPSVSLGEGVIIESSTVVEAAAIDAYSIIEVGARIGKGAMIGANCKICAMVEIAEEEVVRDCTIVWGNGWGERRVEVVKEEMGAMEEGRKLAVEGLGKVLRSLWTAK